MQSNGSPNEADSWLGAIAYPSELPERVQAGVSQAAEQNEPRRQRSVNSTHASCSATTCQNGAQVG